MPTKSSLDRSLNSTSPVFLSSPPKTKCKSCLDSAMATPPGCAASLKRKPVEGPALFLSQQRNDLAVQGGIRRCQAGLKGGGAVVDRHGAFAVRQAAAGFGQD